MRESFKKQQEATEFIRYQEELQERLNEETKAREQLALELSKAEGEWLFSWVVWLCTYLLINWVKKLQIWSVSLQILEGSG